MRLSHLDGDLTLQMAADSNTHLWINGHIVRREVTRFFKSSIAIETIDPRLWLRRGDNTLVVLHHSWGPIVTFQRDGCHHAGFFLSSSWVRSDETWRSHRAEVFAENSEQTVGLPSGKGARRIRFAQFVDGSRIPSASLFHATYDDSTWSPVMLVEDGPWPAHPLSTGLPGQSEMPVAPVLLLAQGRSLEAHIAGVHPVPIEKSILHATLQPAGPQAIPTPAAIEIAGHAGETRYLTVDFGRPVHGFPYLTGIASQAMPVIDFAYGELARSPVTGQAMVSTTGWFDPEAIVGEGYIDRYTTRPGLQHMELPDERTARWWTLHVFFPSQGTFHITQMGFISSQYPTDLKGSYRLRSAYRPHRSFEPGTRKDLDE